MAFGAKNALTKKFPWNTNVNVWMDVYGWMHMDGERIDNRRKKEKTNIHLNIDYNCHQIRWKFLSSIQY